MPIQSTSEAHLSQSSFVRLAPDQVLMQAVCPV